ncbi:MAG TPA: SCP2 sterol-binding domain-containing protein [Paracoccaceae bacterium]|nr:SCP2 sterol-binding domain-containing protein [Paracoccaceae bacterium]HMO72593.1 SCP2 sterol-binding domain-containing protein [Paracoccaceae bacterium]
MTLQEIAERVARKLADRPFEGSLRFDCGEEGVIRLAEGTASTLDGPADCTLALTRENLVKLLTGKLNPMMAMATGKLRLSGDMGVAMRMAKLIG